MSAIPNFLTVFRFFLVYPIVISILEQNYHVSGGHWHHGEIQIDQFFMLRPIPGAAQYKTHLDGLYLCGAGAHPGGGMHGISGKNAAKVVLGDL